MSNDTQRETFYHPYWCDRHRCLTVWDPDYPPLHRKEVATLEAAEGTVGVFLDQIGDGAPAITINCSCGLDVNELEQLRTILAAASLELAGAVEVAR